MQFTEIRQKYPEYNDMSDDDFANKFHQKFYSDMDFPTFAGKVGYAVEQPKEEPNIIQKGWDAFTGLPWRETGVGAAGTLVGAADLAVGIPKAITAAVAAPIRTAIYGDPETQRKVAQEASENVFGTPSEGLRKLGLPEEYISGTVPQKVIEYPFQKLTEGIEAGGDFVAEQTGSRNAGGFAKQMADVALIAAPVLRLHAGLRYTNWACRLL